MQRCSNCRQPTIVNRKSRATLPFGVSRLTSHAGVHFHQFLRGYGLVGLEAGAFHSFLRFRIFHKGIPYKSSARIFRHYQANSSIDPYDVAIIPVRSRIERIHEAIAAPSAGSVAVLNGAKHAHYRTRQKRQRPCGGAWHYGSVDGACYRRSAPYFVTMFGIRGGNAPEVFVVIRKFLAPASAKT